MFLPLASSSSTWSKQKIYLISEKHQQSCTQIFLLSLTTSFDQKDNLLTMQHNVFISSN